MQYKQQPGHAIPSPRPPHRCGHAIHHVRRTGVGMQSQVWACNPRACNPFTTSAAQVW